MVPVDGSGMGGGDVVLGSEGAEMRTEMRMKMEMGGVWKMTERSDGTPRHKWPSDLSAPVFRRRHHNWSWASEWETRGAYGRMHA